MKITTDGLVREYMHDFESYNTSKIPKRSSYGEHMADTGRGRWQEERI